MTLIDKKYKIRNNYKHYKQDLISIETWLGWCTCCALDVICVFLIGRNESQALNVVCEVFYDRTERKTSEGKNCSSKNKKLYEALSMVMFPGKKLCSVNSENIMVIVCAHRSNRFWATRENRFWWTRFLPLRRKHNACSGKGIIDHTDKTKQLKYVIITLELKCSTYMQTHAHPTLKKNLLD